MVVVEAAAKPLRFTTAHFFDRSTSKSAPRLPVFSTFDFEMCFAPQRRALFQRRNFNGVHFSDMSFSKSGPNSVCFVYVDLEMCFAPQQRALFRHLNFQKWSDVGVLCTF